MCERITHLVSVGLARYHLHVTGSHLTLVKVAIGEKTTKNKTVRKWLTRWSLGSLEVCNGCPGLRTGGMAVLDWWYNCPDQSTGDATRYTKNNHATRHIKITTLHDTPKITALHDTSK